ncbi:MAG: phage tail length tape measure family protein [Comamonas sp.]|nr:phage tail length tape measure family protein [Comamonas sp.]
MSEERKANLVIAAENQTKGTLQEIKQDAASMAQSVEQSGQKAAKGLGGIGTGGEQAAKKLDGSTRSIIGSIQRTTATMEAGEKGTAKYFEALGKQRGVSGDVLEPYLAQLRKAELAQAASVKGLGSMEMSAKATAAAMRGVPAQITDIAVSLQGGQRPLTVLLQQGGQLKDMFGGVGAATKALTTTFLGMINPVTVLGSGLVALGTAYYQGSNERDAFVRSIVLTGNASGVTAGQLRAYARQIDVVVGTQAQAAAGLAAFAAAGVRGGEQLKRYTQTAVEWEKATGQAVEKTAEQFASLQKDPLTAVLKLNEGTNFLTTSVYEQIKALELQGDKAGAAQVAMDALNTSMADRGAQIKDSLGYIETAWNGVTGAAKKAWDAMLNVGRPATLDDQLLEVQKRLDVALANQGWGETGEGAATGRATSGYVKQVQDNIKALREQEHALMEKIDAERLNAAVQEESSRVTQSRIEFDKKYASVLQNEISLKDKLVRARKEAEAAGKSEADITKVLAYVTEEHNKSLKKGDGGRKSAESSYKTLMVAINQSVAASENELKVGEKLTESQKLRLKYEQELATRKRAFTEQEKQNIETGLRAAEAAEKEAAAYKELAKAWEDDAKAFDAHIKKQQAQVASINSTVDKLRLEEEGHMLAAAANISHAEAMERITLARLQEAEAQMLQGAGSQEEIERIQREIAARKELLGVLGQKAAREANKKAAEDAAKEWDKTAQTIGNTLSDYIMSGGKDAATYLKRLFSTLVLQPVVQAGVSGVMQSLGVGGAPAGGAGLGNVASMLQNGHSLYGAVTGSLTYGLGSAIAGMGVTLGSTAATSFGAGMAASGFTAGAFGTGASMVGAGATSTGLGMMAGAALPWVAGGLAVFSLLGDLFGSSRPQSARLGGAYSTAGLNDYQVSSALGLNKDFKKAVESRSNAALDTAVQSLVMSITGAYNSLGKYTGGKKLGATAAFADEPNLDDRYSWAAFQLFDELSGKVLANWNSGKALDPDGEKAFAVLSGKMSAAMVAELKSADIPGWMHQVLDSLGSAITLDGLSGAMQQIALIDAAFEGWKDSVVGFEKLNGVVQTTLLNVSGGLEALATNVSGYYQNFYNEQERAAVTTRQLTEALAEYGVALPSSKEDFRELIEQQLAAGDAGAELAAVLLGMQGLFSSVATTWKTELDGMAKEVADFFGAVHESIAGVTADVQATRQSILRGNGAMTASEIQAAITAAMVQAPSTAASIAAQGGVATAAGTVAMQQTQSNTAAAKVTSTQELLSKAQAERDAYAASMNAVRNSLAVNQGQLDSYIDGKRSHYGSRRANIGYYSGQVQKDQASLDAMQPQFDAYNAAVAAQQAALDAATASAKANADALAAAKTALDAAQKAQADALTAYASEVAKYVGDASTSVGKLSELRGEVESFYAAQAQAVQAMLQSAGNIRNVADQVRLSQLTNAQTAQELGARYAMDYSMALATTGSTRAGYVDSMAGNLQSLSNAMKVEASSSAEWQISMGKLLAQASNAAGLLDGDAKNDDYQDVALGLLDSIDTALEGLSTATKSAEQVIADAIAAGTQAQLEGLRAIVAALTGQSIPGFAVGTNYVTQDMTARIHQGEAIIPKAFNPWAGGKMPMGGGDSAAVVAQQREHREEQRAQAAAIVRLLQDGNRILMRWESLGMPEERQENA